MTPPISKVGTARSGRAIVMYLTEDQEFIAQRLAEFALAEHFDAWAVFQRLAVRAKRKWGIDSNECKRYLDCTTLHGQRLTRLFIAAEMQRLELATVFHLMTYAAKLSDNAHV